MVILIRGNGHIDMDEFEDMLQGEPISAKSDVELMEVFKLMDTKGTGYIGAKELKHVTKSIGERLSRKEIQKMINIADSDGDGKVNYDGKYHDVISLICKCLAKMP